MSNHARSTPTLIPPERAERCSDKLHIAGYLLPQSTVDSKPFQNRLLDPRFVIPSRKHLSTTLIAEKHQAISTQLKADMRDVDAICLTMDLWSSRHMRSFIGITRHLVKVWTLSSVMLACHLFRGCHTANNILQQYENTMAHFDISNQISHIVTDSASNMLNYFSLPGFVDTDDQDPDEPDHTTDDDPSDTAFDDLPDHMPCFAHTLQLVVKDGLKSADQLTKVLRKTSTIVSFVRKSTHATDILEGEHRLQTAYATRWNSQLMMIRSVLRVPEEKLESLDLPTKLTQCDRNSLTKACDILSPFEEVTDLGQRDKTVSTSLTISSILGLTSQLESIQAKYHTKILTTLKSCITRRLAPFTTRSELQCATVLYPRFKLEWCSSANEASSVKDIILAEATRITPQDAVRPPPDTEPPRKRSKLFSFMGTRNATVTAPSVDSEMTDYFSQPCSPYVHNWDGDIPTPGVHIAFKHGHLALSHYCMLRILAYILTTIKHC